MSSLLFQSPNPEVFLLLIHANRGSRELLARVTSPCRPNVRLRYKGRNRKMQSSSTEISGSIIISSDIIFSVKFSLTSPLRLTTCFSFSYPIDICHIPSMCQAQPQVCGGTKLNSCPPEDSFLFCLTSLLNIHLTPEHEFHYWLSVLYPMLICNLPKDLDCIAGI